MLTDIIQEIPVLVGCIVGAAIANITWIIGYYFGSSQGSRNKDVLIGKVLTTPPPAPIILPPPQPVPVKPPPPATTTYTLTGKMSVFGGPNDTGMAADEGLALFEESQADQIAGFLLPAQPGVGLGRRLDPSKFYIACRFDYTKTPKEFLRNVGIHVTNLVTGKMIVTRPVDWGPNANTGRIADLSPGAAAALGLKTDDTVTVTIPLPGGISASLPPQPSPTTGEPAWLTAARGEIGFHELPGNHGIQKYVDLAGFGADGEPWCAIFAGAMLRKAGVALPGVNAMARSFSTSPAFTKLDGFRKGAVAVFWRGSPSSDTGHVGFADAETATHVQTIGGNENDAVMIEAVPKAGNSMGLLGYWWPAQLSTSTAAEPNLA